ncbi:MAG: T9SS type A sorting domain-containing protein [Petrimonas sp.]|nr:T9SS type A sorting domain-containing protein [Petrimonas sp.]
MKKIIAIAILIMAGSLVSAQKRDHLNDLRQNRIHPYYHIDNQNDAKLYTMKLDSITSPIYTLSWKYNAQGKIAEEIFDDKFDPEGYSWREAAVFDENGNITRINMYGWNNGNWFHSAYVEYEYNELGQRITRTNANYFGGTWQIGGKGYYTYTASGKLAQYLQQIYWGGTFQDLTKDVYFYDANDKLEKVVYFYSEQGVWDTTIQTIVGYTGDLVESYSEYVKDGGVWENSTKYQWFYSGGNDPVKREYYLASSPTTWSSTQDRYEYRYDQATNANQILFPWESSYFAYDYEWFAMEHKRTEQDWSTTDVNTQQLMFVFTEYYHYSSADNIGITTPDAIAEVTVYPNPATETFSISLPSEYDALSLMMTDITGKIVKTTGVIAGQPVSVSDMPAGCYFITLSDKDKIVGRSKLIIK